MSESKHPENGQEPLRAGSPWYAVGVAVVLFLLAGVVLLQQLEWAPLVVPFEIFLAGWVVPVLIAAGVCILYAGLGGYRNLPLSGGLGGGILGFLLGVAVAYANVGVVFPGPAVDLCWYPACAIPGMLIGGLAGWIGISSLQRKSGRLEDEQPSKTGSAGHTDHDKVREAPSEQIKEGDPPYR